MPEQIEAPGTFLSTIQIVITLVGTLAGAVGEATIVASLAAVPGLAPYAPTIALVVVVVGITYLTLILGELVPKRIALIRAESIASPLRGGAGACRHDEKLCAPVGRTQAIDIAIATCAHVYGGGAGPGP